MYVGVPLSKVEQPKHNRVLEEAHRNVMRQGRPADLRQEALHVRLRNELAVNAESLPVQRDVRRHEQSRAMNTCLQRTIY